MLCDGARMERPAPLQQYPWGSQGKAAWQVSAGADLHSHPLPSQIKMPSKKLAHIPVYALGFETVLGTLPAKVLPVRRRDAFQ